MTLSCGISRDLIHTPTVNNIFKPLPALSLMEFSYETLTFLKLPSTVRCLFLKNFYFDLAPQDLDVFGEWSIDDGKLLVESDDQSLRAIMQRIIDQGLERLTHAVTGNPTIYLHRGCGIPLIGNPGWGIVDRGTNIIEIKMVTGCNLKCIYCSISEGGDEKQYEFVIEADYLVDELEKVLKEKDINKQGDQVEIHIGVHGEPFLYGDMLHLCREIRRRIPSVEIISVDTNGTFLTEELVDQLADAGMTRINMSLDSMDPTKAKEIAGTRYNIKHVLHMIEYITHHPKMDCLVAPVWMQGINDDDMREVIKLAKDKNIQVGIQNYMNYKGGRNLYKAIGWDDFFERLAKLEEEVGHKLVMNFYSDFEIRNVPPIKKPFKKGQVIEARIACPARLANQMIGVSGPRNITLFGDKLAQKKIGDTVRARITRDKHNIFYAEVF